MTAKANSQTAEYIDAAKRRWQGYTVSGSGSLAVIYHCAHRIELVATPIEACAIVAERCGPYCSHIRTPEGGWHLVETVKLPLPRTIVMLRDWED
jgi:hypothetical protein